ncbi:DUF4824 family protein [Rhodocyclaceae bacterium SMB388]
MRLSRRLTPILGIALIAITNAVALAGVAWNRAGEPDGVLVLSERELRRPFVRFDRENSGMALTLDWRIAPPAAADGPGWFRSSVGVAPEWLDQAKMESLGFVFPATAAEDPDRWRRHRLQSGEVLLVLEFDGPAYRHSLDHVRRHAEAEIALLESNPDSDEFTRRAANARERLRTEEQNASRLFVVDAGMRHAALRLAYPDRNRHIIVRGQITPWLNDAYPGGPRGFIRRLHIASINVPFAYRDVLGTIERRVGMRRGVSEHAFSAEVAFGRRLEPWIVSVAASE